MLANQIRSTIILCEGVDRSGKSTLAKALSTELSIPYYKNSIERSQKRKSETKTMTRFAVPYLFDFLDQVFCECIMDRNWPSEFAYGQVENRDIDLEDIRFVDDYFAEHFNGAIIICYRSDYTREDFIDELTPFENIQALIEKYKEFATWTHCKNVFLLDTTNKTVEEQMQIVLQFLDTAKVTQEIL